MQLLILLCISAAAFGQASLIGVNSAAKELPVGARDVVTSITVDPSAAGGDLLAVMLAADGVAIQIELPSGRRLTKENSEAAGFTWEISGEASGDDALFPGLQGKVNHLIMLPAGAPKGKYSIHADARGLKQKTAVQVIFLPLGNPGASDAGAGDTVRVALLEGEMFHYAGQKVTLVAGVFEGNRGIANAKLSGLAVAVDKNGVPVGKPVPLQFKAGGAGAAGSYNAELLETAAGEYSVSVKANGKYANGTLFERVAGTTVTIQPLRARLLRVTEQPVDLDCNGLIDRIDVTAEVHVDLPGEYSMTVDLKAASGKYMQAYGRATLEAGEKSITASFDRYSLTHVGADGPYRISARLFRKEQDSDGFASLLEDAGKTRDYNQASFDRGALYFTGAVRATPESPASFAVGRARPTPPSATGGEGYDRLAITFDVFTPGGNCHWVGGLGEGYHSLGFLNGDGTLPKGAGQITFVFDGLRISDRADGKVLHVESLALNCGGLQAQWDGGQVPLPAFPAGTFTKPPASFQLEGLLEVFRIIPGSAVNEVVFVVKTMGGFNEALEFTVEGLPPGVVVKDLPPVKPIQELLIANDTLRFQLVPIAVPRGTYKFTLRAKGKTIERTKILTISVQ
jgi:hypothetical protein